MIFKKAKLSQQIFISMIALISFSLLIVAVINIIQIQNETRTYNIDRLSRKDRAVAKSIESIINIDSASTLDLKAVFKPILKEVGYIHKLKINIYSLNGEFIWASDTTLLRNDLITTPIQKVLLDSCFSTKAKKINYEKGDYFGTYRLLYQNSDKKQLTSSEPSLSGKPFCILDVVYDKSTSDDITKKTNQQLEKFLKIYILLLFISVGFAYFLQQRITSPLRSISKRLSTIKLKQTPEPLIWPVQDEIGQLVGSYNNLMIELHERTQQLIKSEKEGAWKKMARQIAHEIKNPLTPMRLSVQYLQKSFNDGEKKGLYSDGWGDKLEDFSKTMIQQIDTLTRIANAFSDFASLSAQKIEKIDIEKEVEKIIHLFKNNNVKFFSNIKLDRFTDVLIDKTHLTRILNNLIKNSLQAEREDVSIEVIVELSLTKKDWVLSIKDNGSGIPEEIKNKIFEPNFTTKNSGMGLGLAMVKKIIDDLQGSITYSTSNSGTVFDVMIPRTK